MKKKVKSSDADIQVATASLEADGSRRHFISSVAKSIFMISGVIGLLSFRKGTTFAQSNEPVSAPTNTQAADPGFRTETAGTTNKELSKTTVPPEGLGR